MLDLLTSKDFVIFTTREFANQGGLSISAAAKRLSRLLENDLLVRVTKGVWANTRHPYFHPLSCVPYLLGKEQGYVSFLTALHLHAVVSQIPPAIQVFKRYEPGPRPGIVHWRPSRTGGLSTFRSHGGFTPCVGDLT